MDDKEKRHKKMTRYGKINLIGMLSLPVMTMIAIMLASMNGVFDAYAATYSWLFVVNCIPMLFAGLTSWLLLRKASSDTGRLIAITPTLIPATIGIVWYLWRAIVPDEIGPGTEYIAAPQYLMIWVAAISVLAFVVGRTISEKK